MAPHQDETTSHVWDLVTPPGPWTTLGPLSRGFSQQNVPPQPSLGILDSEKWFAIQRSANFTVAHFVQFRINNSSKCSNC